MHADRGKRSRYWFVTKELHAFAKREATMLDIGCNDGVYTIPYCMSGGRALGIDISSNLIKKASDEAARQGVECRFMKVDIESRDAVEEISERFDLVLLSEVLEHVRDQAAVMKNVQSLVKSRGHFMITSPTPMLEDLIPFDLRYVHEVLRGKTLLEKQVIDTRDVPIFRQYGVSNFLYRHDAYYPRALRKYIEDFGFKARRFYTVGMQTPLMAFRRSVARVGKERQYIPEGASRSSPAVEASTFPKRAWAAIKYSNRYFEPLLRHLPVLKLLGASAIGIFRKIE